MKTLAAFAVVFAALFVPLSVRADDTVPGPQRTIVLHNYVVYGHPARPLAVTDTAALPVKMTLTPLRQPLLDRIEPTVCKAPF